MFGKPLHRAPQPDSVGNLTRNQLTRKTRVSLNHLELHVRCVCYLVPRFCGRKAGFMGVEPGRIFPVIDRLPDGFAVLADEATAEGFRHMQRLADEWQSGALRFSAPGERLLAAAIGGDLAAIGGISRDPVVGDALRMRRFYVRAHFRRRGIARDLARVLIDQVADAARPITVAAGTKEAPAFWESLGFAPDARDGHTHVLRRTC